MKISILFAAMALSVLCIGSAPREEDAVEVEPSAEEKIARLEAKIAILEKQNELLREHAERLETEKNQQEPKFEFRIQHGIVLAFVVILAGIAFYFMHRKRPEGSNRLDEPGIL